MLCCGGISALMFPLQFDLYTATSTQSAYGELERTWSKLGQYRCNILDVDDNALEPGTTMTYAPRAEMVTPQLLTAPGRVLQELFVTNIKDMTGTTLWFEPHDGIDNNTVFELLSVVPVVGLTGRLSHYKYTLARAQRQAVTV